MQKSAQHKVCSDRRHALAARRMGRGWLAPFGARAALGEEYDASYGGVLLDNKDEFWPRWKASTDGAGRGAGRWGPSQSRFARHPGILVCQRLHDSRG